MALKALKLTVIFLFLAKGSSAFGLDYFADPPSSRVLDTESRLAQGFLVEAKKRLASGLLIEAEQWAVRGLQLDPAAADLLLLRSRISQQGHEALDQALDMARSAVRSNRWIEGRFLDAFTQLIDVQIQMHAYKNAREEFTSRFNDRDLLRDPRLAGRYISILYNLNEREKADSLLASALDAWPDDARLMAVMMQWRSPSPSLHRWFDRFHSESADFRQALFWYANALPPSSERLKRCEEYINAGGEDSAVIPWALESALVAEGADREFLEGKWVERFLTIKVGQDLDAAAKLYELLSTEPAKIRFWQALAGTSALMIRDFDHDGHAEEYIQFINGAIKFWMVDANQDNRVDLRLDWSAGRLAFATQSSRLRTVRASFDAYPEIDRVEVLVGDQHWALSMPQGRVEFPAIEMPAEGFQHPLQILPWLTVGKRNIMLDPAVLRQSANEQTTFISSPSGAPIVLEQIKLQSGQALASLDDSDQDGKFDHLLWYDQGMPALGFRDVENSGRFDAFEIFQNGRLSEVVHIDPVLGQSYRLDVINRLSEWDLDQNGVVDTLELRNANLGLIQWFSTRLDGKFDLRAEDGQVKSILLAGFSKL